MKPLFEDIYIETEASFVEMGNKVGAFKPIAVIVTDKEGYNKKKNEKYIEYEKVYNKHINTKQRFKANKSDVIACITRINPKTKSVSWKQCNWEKMKNNYPSGYKPAKGKWPVIAMIQFFLNNQIEFLD